MAGRPTYSDDDKARVYVVLKANEGIIKRTERDTGVASATIRRWRKEWDKDGPPDIGAVEAAAGDFVSQAEKTRWKALLSLDQKIPDAKPGELVNVIGMLDDKIARARGLISSRTEHVLALPSGEDIRAALAGFLVGGLEMSRLREQEIEDADVIDMPAPPKELEQGR